MIQRIPNVVRIRLVDVYTSEISNIEVYFTQLSTGAEIKISGESITIDSSGVLEVHVPKSEAMKLDSGTVLCQVAFTENDVAKVSKEFIVPVDLFIWRGGYGE